MNQHFINIDYMLDIFKLCSIKFTFLFFSTCLLENFKLHLYFGEGDSSSLGPSYETSNKTVYKNHP